uniref:Fibronectin type III domain n=1 Tax=Candidatus Kentrum eta TaxID=2126337 RepID=A0A450UD69_9GAMM|nr:MAG: Fibronectin type III domain [Candidatus Kentron sp. H]VFJ90268.1 MAG: Fibronectin type III domain [Candidatus Kentron sp. H]VFJ96621.1 MAG: Fibronectin type III domain [Candidatus Kentron sp. H]
MDRPLAPLDRAQNLTGVREAAGQVRLQWEKPVEGGKVAAYQIMCRERAVGGEWDNEGTAMETEKMILAGQPQGVEMEYGVMAMNRAGEGPISNTVVVLL